MLLGLGGEKVAVSVNVANFAAGLSDKLENGDIVSVIIYDKEMYTSYIPAELKYVKVITTTTNEGVDKDEIVEGGKAATVTVLVTHEQAELLAHYNSVTTIHFSCLRGETDKADAYIKVQDDYLKNNPIDNTPKETERRTMGKLIAVWVRRVAVRPLSAPRGSSLIAPVAKCCYRCVYRHCTPTIPVSFPTSVPRTFLGGTILSKRFLCR